MQKFLWPEMWVVGAGWPEKFRPAPKTPKSVFEKILGVGSPFGGSVGSLKPKNGVFRPKIAYFRNFGGRKWGWPERKILNLNYKIA